MHLDAARSRDDVRVRPQVPETRPQAPRGQSGRDGPAGREQVGARPAAGLEPHGRRRLPPLGRERVREVQDASDVGAAEGVDRLVRVTDGDQVPAATGQRLQEPDLRRVGVLVFVDEDHGPGGPLPVAQGAVGLEQPGRRRDQAGLVEDLAARVEVEAALVGVQEPAGGHPVGAVVERTEPTEPGPVDPTLLGPQQQVAQLLPESAQQQRGPELGGPAVQAVLDLTAQQPGDLDILLGAGQQPQRRPLQLPPQQGERIAVEGHRHRSAGGAAQPGGDALPQLGCGLAAEGEHQHLLGLQVPGLDAVHHRLDQRGGLARPRSGEHEQGSARMLDHLALRHVEHRRRVGGRCSTHEGRRGVDHAGSPPPTYDNPGGTSRAGRRPGPRPADHRRDRGWRGRRAGVVGGQEVLTSGCPSR